MKIFIIFSLVLAAAAAASLGEEEEEVEDSTGKIDQFRIGPDAETSFNATDVQTYIDLLGSDFTEPLSATDIIFNACELEKYKEPKELKDIFPYYHSGYDDDGRPIWVGEFGQYNLRKVSTGSKKLQEEFDRYVIAVTYHMLRSIFENGRVGRPTFEFIFIVDFEGLSPTQMTLGNLQVLLKLAKRYTRLIDDYAKEIMVINVNFLAEQVTNLFRPVMGRVFEKIKIFSTNKSKWLGHLRKSYPKASLPEWYGGSKGFQPVGIYGR